MNSTVKFLVNMAVLTAIAGSGAVAQTAGMRSLRNELANRPVLEIRVYDYAHLDGKTLGAAENEADRIFSNAGVNIRWVSCPTSHAQVDAFPECSATPGADSNTVIIWTKAPGAAANADVLGEAGDRNSRRSFVYYRSIEDVAGGSAVGSGMLTGRVIAHVVGYALLGEDKETAGVLRTSWDDEQLSLTAGAHVLFTRDEAHRMVSLAGQNTSLAVSQAPENVNGQ